MSNEKPLEAFYPILAASPLVKEALGKQFGEKTDKILLALSEGIELPEELSAEECFISDLVENEAELVREFATTGSEAGDYPIYVMGYEGVYFVQAPQFDTLAFFGTEKEAVEALFGNWIDAWECD